MTGSKNIKSFVYRTRLRLNPTPFVSLQQTKAITSGTFVSFVCGINLYCKLFSRPSVLVLCRPVNLSLFFFSGRFLCCRPFQGGTPVLFYILFVLYLCCKSSSLPSASIFRDFARQFFVCMLSRWIYVVTFVCYW